MKKKKLKKWVKVVITLLMIHVSFFIWKQVGLLGELAQRDTIYLILCVASWIYLTLGQALVYGALWEK